MGWWAVLALLGVCVGVWGDGQQPVYSGFLGCRFSRSVCQEDEECIDDRLFGSCQKIGTSIDFYQYYLDGQTLRSLEKEIQRLILADYTWSSLYTQCILGNILLAFRRDQEPDRYWCDRGGTSSRELDGQSLTKESLEMLERYFQDYYNALTSGEQRGQLPDEDSVDVENLPDLPSHEIEPLEKKDDLIRVHKYFVDDRNLDSGESVAVPAEDEVENIEGSPYDRLLGQLSQQDLDLLTRYLQDLDSEPSRSDEPDFRIFEDRDEDVRKEIDDTLGSQVDQLGYVWDEGKQELPAENAETVETGEEVVEEDMNDPGDEVTLTPSEAKLLGDLLQEKVSVADLSEEETDRLTSIVDRMLAGMDQFKAESAAEKPDDDMVSESQVLKDAEMKRTGGAHSAVKKEQMNMDVLSNPSGNSHIHVEVAPGNKRILEPVVTPASGSTADDNFAKDPHDYHFQDDTKNTHTGPPKLMAVNQDFAYLQIKPENSDQGVVEHLLEELESLMDLDPGTFTYQHSNHGEVAFRVNENNAGRNGHDVADFAKSHVEELKNRTGLIVVNAGFGDKTRVSVDETENGPKYFVLTFVLCGCIAGIVLAVIALYVVRRHSHSKEKLAQLAHSGDGTEASKDYQDLCRQRMQSKASEKPEPLNAAQRVGSVSTSEVRSPSSRSSTSSWSEEPVTSNMDISTGHIVLSYMEDHLKNKDRLDQEWEALCAYEAEPNAITVGAESTNMRKNRYSDILPYDHSRVVLSTTTNVSGSDYVNASTITDHDPRNPAYIATIGPLPHTVADFWQMVWEQGSVVIVMLTKLTENGVAMCHRYWPEEGSDLYHIYEVHLVSEHIWCDDYLVRSFYLKNLQTNETRTVTQFHFLTWPDLGVPSSPKALLEFRRKVNKSYRGRSCPIVVHCSDGVGRSGTYTLIDMVLNRMSKGAKEIDIAATLEHIRDQRICMVKTKEQFEYALASVAEEVHAILKALPQ